MNRINVLLCVLFLWAFSGKQAMGEYVLGKDTLKGITKLWVITEKLSEDGRKLGLTESTLQTNTELALRMAGVEVVPYDDPERFRFPYLYVNASIIADETSRCSYRISLELRMLVQLENGNSTHGTIWDTGCIGFCGHTRAQSVIPESLQETVNTFLNDFLAANPKAR